MNTINKELSYAIFLDDGGNKQVGSPPLTHSHCKRGSFWCGIEAPRTTIQFQGPPSWITARTQLIHFKDPNFGLTTATILPPQT